MRLLLALLLMTVGATAWAEWVPYYLFSDRTLYVDLSTVKRDGDFSRVWTIGDFEERNKNGELSYRSHEEFDCKNEMHRLLVLELFSEHMARGNSVGKMERGPTRWEAIAPDTAGRALLEHVCKKWWEFVLQDLIVSFLNWIFQSNVF